MAVIRTLTGRICGYFMAIRRTRASSPPILSEEKMPATTADPMPQALGLTLEEILTEQFDFLHYEAF